MSSDLCEYHVLVGPDIYADPPTVTCEVCGYTEPADPLDVAEQLRLLRAIDEADARGVR